MSDQKKNQIVADDRKASSITADANLTPANEGKKKIYKAPKVKKPRKKGLPIAVDILIVIALLAVIAGAAWGVYILGNHFASSYEPKEITYTLLARDVDAALAYDADGNCVIVPESDVFVLEQEQRTPVGQVLSVSPELQEDGTVNVYVTVRTTADYEHELGYFVGKTKIAVGKEYACRFYGLVSDAVIVELQVTEKES